MSAVLSALAAAVLLVVLIVVGQVAIWLGRVVTDLIDSDRRWQQRAREIEAERRHRFGTQTWGPS